MYDSRARAQNYFTRPTSILACTIWPSRDMCASPVIRSALSTRSRFNVCPSRSASIVILVPSIFPLSVPRSLTAERGTDDEVAAGAQVDGAKAADADGPGAGTVEHRMYVPGRRAWPVRWKKEGPLGRIRRASVGEIGRGVRLQPENYAYLSRHFPPIFFCGNFAIESALESDSSLTVVLTVTPKESERAMGTMRIRK